MHQIDNSTAAAVLPASTNPGVAGYFTDGNLLAGEPPTILPAEFLNAIMLELLNVITAAGIAPSKANNAQLLAAVQFHVQRRGINYGTDIGAVANTILLTFAPAISAYGNGLVVACRIKFANTGACTINPGAGAVPLLCNNGTELKSGDLPQNALLVAIYDVPTNAFWLIAPVRSQLGQLATLNIGSGLIDDGAGNLMVDPAGLATTYYMVNQ